MIQEQQTNSLMHQLKKHFELVNEPFSAHAPFFYEGAQRRHNLETLKHLTIFGDLVLFLTGEKGAGKSHLLRQFQAEAENEIRSVFIDCDLAMQTGNGRQVSIVQSCLHALNMPVQDESFEDSCSRLVQECARQQALDGRRSLVIFDCADKLPRQQVLTLCGFFRSLPEESPLIILFSGSHSLLQNSKLGANLEQNAWWHQIQLKPLSSDEIMEYLNQALQAAGYAQSLELNEQQLTQLVQVGKGLPGRINKVFPSVVLEPGLLKLPTLRRTKTISFGLLVGLAGLLVLSFLIVAFQHGVFERFIPVFSLESAEISISEQQSKKEIEVVAADLETEKQQSARLALLNAELEKQGISLQQEHQEELVISAESASLQQGQSENIEELADVQEPLSEQTVIVDPKPLASIQADSGVERGNEATLSTGNLEENSPDSVEKEVSLPVVEKVAEKVKAESKKRHAAFREKSWLQSQAKNAYIPQILGSFEEQTAIKFIRQLGEQKVDIYYLETEHKGRPWFVVFYGIFNTKADAQAAVRAAPERIQKQSPWLRSVESVLGSYPTSR